MAAEDCFSILDSPDREWWPDAACKSVGPEVFFPDPEDPDLEQKIATAQALCVNCAMREVCFYGAKERREEFGIWGGVYVEDPEFSW